jgi:hypothetical protein
VNLRAFSAKEDVRQLQEYAGSVAGRRIASDGAAMLEVLE